MKQIPVPLIMSRIFNQPLMIHEPKLNVILVAFKDRLGINVPENLAQEAPAKYSLSTEAKNPGRQTGSKPQTVAVIPVHDTLVHEHSEMRSYSGMTSYMYIRNAFRTALSSNDVSAIILHIDSPGGEAHGVRELAQEIYEARGEKPIYAVVDEHAFSAAYYIASAADRIYVPNTGGVGSVGVIAKHIDQSRYEEKEGFKVTSIYAGVRKNELSPHEPLTDEGAQTIQEMVDHHYDLFVEAVARNRDLSAELIRGTEAALYWGKNAIKAGLADEIGTLEAAIKAALTPKGAAHIKTTSGGQLPGKETIMDKEKAIVPKTIEELAAMHPDLAAELREQGAKSVDVDGTVKDAVSQETDRILGLADIQFGADAGKNFREIVQTGTTVEQYKAIAAVNPPAATQSAEAKLMGKMLDEIKKVGTETPGMGGDLDVSAMPDGLEKWRAEYARNPELQTEFKTAETYVAFKKGVSEGRVKILGRKEVN